MIKLLYFARLREELGSAEEFLELPDTISTVRQLHGYLCDRTPQWNEVLQRPGLFIAVNQTVVEWDHALSGDEEIGLFPPVTGG